jgi:hypothetical protein
MKEALTICLIIGTVSFSIFALWFYINTHNNVINSKKIKIGDSRNLVIQIMGNPNDERTYKFKKDTLETNLLFYEPPFGASEGIDIYIKKDTVSRITLYEGEARYN